jgi:hypothetical protein
VLVTWFGLFLSSNSTDSCLVTKIGLWRMCLWFERLKPTLLLCCVVQNNNLLLINLLVWWWVTLSIQSEPNQTADENPIIEFRFSVQWLSTKVCVFFWEHKQHKKTSATYTPLIFCYILQHFFFLVFGHILQHYLKILFSNVDILFNFFIDKQNHKLLEIHRHINWKNEV